MRIIRGLHIYKIAYKNYFLERDLILGTISVNINLVIFGRTPSGWGSSRPAVEMIYQVIQHFHLISLPIFLRIKFRELGLGD